MTDNINHPSHYGHGRVEVAVAMDILGAPWQWLGHALKYACRAPHKGQEREDIKKAIWCVSHALELDPNVTWPDVAMRDRSVLAHALRDGVSDPKLRAFILAIVLAEPRPQGALTRDLVRLCLALEDAYNDDAPARSS